LGRYLVSTLLERDDVYVLGIGRSAVLKDNFTHCLALGSKLLPAPVPEYLKRCSRTERYVYASVDLLDLQRTSTCIREFKPDIVFHMASALRDDPVDTLFRTNVLGTTSLIEAIAGSHVTISKLILGSSGSVYGEVAEVPIKEDTCCRPADLYATSKLSTEHASRILGRDHNIPCVWARIFNLVGPGQNERHICGRLMNQITGLSTGEYQGTIRVGNLYPTRDYIDVRDAARLLCALAERGTVNSTYNIGTGVETSVREILECCLRLVRLDRPISIEQVPGRTSDIRRLFANIEKVRAIDAAPFRRFEDSLRDLMAYYLGLWSPEMARRDNSNPIQRPAD
jgi:GDP-4-dehydro-6-deoxy-D-mannose reductase